MKQGYPLSLIILCIMTWIIDRIIRYGNIKDADSKVKEDFKSFLRETTFSRPEDHKESNRKLTDVISHPCQKLE